ncbi:MAG: response regulator [candidate division WOR-3 bacterium]|nr:response regulator [candidate division WOR-3 bacterium]MCX7836659.1 response regulator [candidate division WOR-3 bacterium]MDW8113700.1 response regulator [candidate division WOR-3 bacterium]
MKKILIIEDEEAIRFILEKRLSDAGYLVISAENGIEGLNKARKENPDLILLDLMLPGIDGYQICSILKRDRRYAHIPIIILTARIQQKDYELAIELGADAFLTKPFESQVLLSKIEELLKNNKKEE